MSRAEDNSRSVNGMTLNDNRLSGERKRPSEPSEVVKLNLSRCNNEALRNESEGFCIHYSLPFIKKNITNTCITIIRGNPTVK